MRFWGTWSGVSLPEIVPSCRELNSDDFPFFRNLSSSSGTKDSFFGSCYKKSSSSSSRLIKPNQISDHHPLSARWWIKRRRQIQKDRYTNTKSNTKTKTMWNTQIHFGQSMGVELHFFKKWSSTGVEFHFFGVELHFFGVELHFFTVELHFKFFKKTIELHRRKCTNN